MKPEPELMTVGMTARELERSADTVREYERRGRLAATRVGGIRIFRREDVQRLKRELDGERAPEHAA